MINVEQAKTDLAKHGAEDVVVSKAQYALLLDEVARGNAARILLTNVTSIISAGRFAA
jgi:hypothetical protein